MKRTFITLASIVFLIWGGSNLWLAGYQQGYEQGETQAWTRANGSFQSISRYNRENATLTLASPKTAELTIRAENVESN